jgi:hypothetical protein
MIRAHLISEGMWMDEEPRKARILSAEELRELEGKR